MIEVEKIETQGREESLTREPSHFFETYETFLTNLHVIMRRAETMKTRPGYASLPACSLGERRIYRNQTWVRFALGLGAIDSDQ
jgi:hypothetical protein